MRGVPWTEDEDAILRRLYPLAEEGEIAVALPGRTWTAIRSRTVYLGIKRWKRYSRSNARAIHPLVDKLRSIREFQDVTRGDLSVKAGFNVAQIQGWEFGKYPPRLWQVADWANALGYELVLQPKVISEVIPFPSREKLMGRK